MLWRRLWGGTATGMDVATRTRPLALEAREQLPAGTMTALRGDRWSGRATGVRAQHPREMAAGEKADPWLRGRMAQPHSRALYRKPSVACGLGRGLRASLLRERLLGERMAGIENQRLALSLRLADLAGKIRPWGRIQHVYPPVPGARRADGSDGGGIDLLVGDPQPEVVPLEEGDLDDRARVVMDAPARRQDPGVSGSRQRDAGVADRVGPPGDASGVGNRRVEQLLDAEFLGGLRERGVQALGVLPEHVDLRGIRAEL